MLFILTRRGTLWFPRLDCLAQDPKEMFDVWPGPKPVKIADLQIEDWLFSVLFFFFCLFVLCCCCFKMYYSNWGRGQSCEMYIRKRLCLVSHKNGP